MFRSSYGLVLDTKKNLLPRIFCHEYMLCVCTNVHFCVCDFIYLVHFENIRNMIKSYEPSLIGIPLLEKNVSTIFLQEKNLKLTSNISFNLAFLLCSRFCLITRNAISALSYFSRWKCMNGNLSLFLVNITPLCVTLF